VGESSDDDESPGLAEEAGSGVSVGRTIGISEPFGVGFGVSVGTGLGVAVAWAAASSAMPD
jgi:pantoate kinase